MSRRSSLNQNIVNEEENQRVTEEDSEQQKEEELQMSGEISKFPRDVFLDILSRLPIKSLSQSRWVCKPCCNILHSPLFTKMHHARASQHNLPCLILHDRFNYTSNFNLVEQEALDSLPTSTTVLKTHFNRSKELFDVVGSCNGLLCLTPLSSHDPVYICNPVTGEYMRLPKPSKYTNGVNISDVNISAFGFAPTTNEYKVVCMLHYEIDERRSFKVEVEVYTLGSGRWRSIADFPYPLTFKRSHVFVNGALHWITYESSKVNLSELIVSFDVGSEEFRAVPPPPGFSPGRASAYYNLGVLDERLCLIDNSFNNRIVVWALKDYGVKESWTKEYVIKKKVFEVFVFGIPDFKLLRLMENGEILLLYHHKDLGYYDPKRKSFRRITIHGIQSLDQLEAIAHVESLISLRNIGG